MKHHISNLGSSSSAINLENKYGKILPIVHFGGRYPINHSPIFSVCLKIFTKKVEEDNK